MKLKVGVVFAGPSREREISFAGGRTVYDNLNKTLFEAVPLFIDSLGNIILLNWEFVYKGTIRDFYPPVEVLPSSPNGFQVYVESLGLMTRFEQESMVSKVGQKIKLEDLTELIDFAFLCLHGSYGEDGRIQGMFEFLGIPYSGSGILSSAIGINKAIQKKLMREFGFDSPPFFTLKRSEWNHLEIESFLVKIKDEIGFPFVVKPANQGSSIGVSILTEADKYLLLQSIDKAFFRKEINGEDWNKKSIIEKIDFIRQLTDIREGIGMPVWIGENNNLIYHPEELLKKNGDAFFYWSAIINYQ